MSSDFTLCVILCVYVCGCNSSGYWQRRLRRDQPLFPSRHALDNDDMHTARSDEAEDEQDNRHHCCVSQSCEFCIVIKIFIRQTRP